MKIVLVTNQSEWDALPSAFPEYTVIEIRSKGWITIKKVPTGSRAVLSGSSSAVLWDSSRAVLWESSSAELRDSSSAVLRDSSSAVLRDSSSAVLWAQSTAHHKSTVAPQLHGQSVCFHYGAAPAPTAADDAIVIPVKERKGVEGWIEREGIVVADGAVILYKRVSAKFQTQEGTWNETTWTLGAEIVHPAWNPTSGECGEGKYHACSRPYFCDEFRNIPGDVYIAIRVAVADLYAWDGGAYPHKIAFRAGTVLHQVDRWGDEIAAQVTA